MEPTCPVCHTTVRPTDFFCYNCGKNLHEKPWPISPLMEALYYAGSVFLPPLGLWWGFKFLKVAEARAKRIAIVSIVLTFLATFVSTLLIVKFFQGVSAQVNQQMNQFPGGF